MEVEGTSEEQGAAVNGVKTKEEKKEKEKEGSFLLGSPTFTALGNGRFKCDETGHELPAKERESYTRSKACCLALIDAAVAQKIPPLNKFQQCPLSKSKLVCQLTGDTIKKSEEHISAMEDDEKIKADESASMEGHPVEKNSDSEELDFWIPPVGDRWDYDDGKDLWESQRGSEH